MEVDKWGGVRISVDTFVQRPGSPYTMYLPTQSSHIEDPLSTTLGFSRMVNDNKKNTSIINLAFDPYCIILQRKLDTKVKRRDKCNIVRIYGKNNRDSEAMARSSTILDIDDTVDEEVMDEEAMDKKREEYENCPKKVNKSQ
jgi:hypothetical protein